MKNEKRNCFSFCDERCRVLKSQDCYKCKFYKTAEQFEDDQERTRKRFEAKGIDYDEFLVYWKSRKNAGY